MTGFGERLSNLIRKLMNKPIIDKEAVEKTLTELKKILLQADVEVEIVKKLIEEIKKDTLKEKIPSGLTLREHVIKTIYNKLVEILGKEFSLLKGKKIMLIGLFGSGKPLQQAR